MNGEHPSDFDLLPAVARAAIAARLSGSSMGNPPDASGALRRSAPVFVTLQRDGELRGCIGTLSPLCADLVAEVADRAVAAAFEDPRFPPLTADELPRCSIEVSILGPLEPIASADQLDPQVFGVEIDDALGRRGVLLPGIDGVDTVAQQLAIVRHKAGIPTDAPIRMQRFRVIKVTERPTS